MSPMVMIRQSRLALLARLASKRPQCILDLLGAVWEKDLGWVVAVRSDLVWFSCSGFFADPLCASVPCAFNHISRDSSSFVRALRRYSATRYANFDVPMSIPSIAPPLFLNSTCTICGKCFNSFQKLALHKKVKHGYRDPVDRLVDTVWCPICMLYFHDRIRLLNHLKYRSKLCQLNLFLSGPLISPERADQLDVDCRELRRSRRAAGLRAHAATAPVIRLQGPLPPPRIPVIYSSARTHILGNGRRHYG